MIRMGMGDTAARQLFDRRVAQPLELEDGRPPGLRSAALQVISYTIIGVIAWAAITEVREVAVARGELIPAGKIQAVQHFEGGIVDDVLVKAGSFVREGDPIVRLKPKQVSSDFDQLRARMAWLELEEARLKAEQSGDKPDFSRWSAAHPELVAPQEAAYAANMVERTNSYHALDIRIDALKSQVEALNSQIKNLQAEIETHREIFDMQTALAENSLTPRRVMLDAKIALQRANSSLTAAMAARGEANSDLAQAIGEKEKTTGKIHKDIADLRAKNMQQRAELTHQLDKLSDRVDRLLVRAPVDGFVKDVGPKGAGTVLQPGQLIAEIVPKDQKLVAEVRIQPRDIGHIKTGEPAELEVTTYDVNIQGRIKGRVTDISASSFKSETGEPYFRGEISFDLDAQEESIRKVALIPGMIVEANIITGSKSILRYILKPIYRSLDHGFTER
jgi:membrane fusion protein, adhesin transport system